MIRKEAIEIAIKEIGNQPIISANGYISRDLYNVYDKHSNFYMIGSMGLASSIGLGVALKNSKKRIFVFDGDGNILMNLGSLTTISSQKPKNLVHVVFDNSVHESTGSQPTNSNFLKIIHKIKKLKGPIMILVKIQQSKGQRSERIKISPVRIKERFMQSI